MLCLLLILSYLLSIGVAFGVVFNNEFFPNVPPSDRGFINTLSAIFWPIAVVFSVLYKLGAWLVKIFEEEKKDKEE